MSDETPQTEKSQETLATFLSEKLKEIKKEIPEPMNKNDLKTLNKMSAKSTVIADEVKKYSRFTADPRILSKAHKLLDFAIRRAEKVENPPKKKTVKAADDHKAAPVKKTK